MLASEGYPTIIVVFLFAILVAWGVSFVDHWFVYVVYSALFLLCGLIVYFFRDPERNIPNDTNLIVAPADGKIVLIRGTNETEYIGENVTQISIFLSPLDVHVNRVPVEGELEYVKYYPGKYLMAWDDHASELNERAHFGVKHPSGIKFLFKQITGFLARRIVYHIREGDELKTGERFGIMKFGSRMDVLMPDSIELNVKEGDKTVAGETILGVIRQ
jgi:phosphatidylserine decarboxylase